MFKIVSIDGNIGSGKSTFLKSLKAHHAETPNVVFLTEPVNEWLNIQDENGTHILEHFYNDPSKYAFAFQMMAFISRLNILKQAIKESEKETEKETIIVTERSLFTDKNVFAKMLFEAKHIDPIMYQIYTKWFDAFAHDFPVHLTVYIQTKPEICMSRIEKRSRSGENNIGLEYLTTCHEKHEAFMENAQLVLNGDEELDDNGSLHLKWIEQIDSLLFPSEKIVGLL